MVTISALSGISYRHVPRSLASVICDVTLSCIVSYSPKVFKIIYIIYLVI